MRLDILCFVIGAWLLQQQPELPALAWAWVLLPLAGGVWLLPSDRGRGLWFARQALAKSAFLAAGFFWAAGCAAWRLADALPAEWEGRDVEVIGVVAELPRSNEASTRFEFDVNRILTPGAVVPEHIVLSWFRERGESEVPRLRAGELWRLTVRLKRPHGSANPHGFDFEAWALERGIRASGYVRRAGSNARLEAASTPSARLQRLRQEIRDRFVSVLGDRPYAGIVVALAVGDQNAIPRDQWQVFTRTGVNHLMSISGLHITMISGLVFALVQASWRRSSRLTLALPARKAAALAGALAALGYALLAGFGVPAQRTLLMLSVVAAGLWLGTSVSASRVLAVALFAVVVYDPWAVLQPGFWLSFGAVAIIFYVNAGRIGRSHWLASWARVQWAITIGLVPPLIALFQQVSLASPVANAFAIPVVSLVVVPLTLLAIVIPLDAVLLLAHGVMGWCMAALEWLAALPEATWSAHAPPAWAVAAAAGGAAWLLAPRGFPARWAGALALAPLFFTAAPAPAAGGYWLTVLDVGQGLAAVVRTRNHALLYDAGPWFSPGSDSGNRVIVPFLRGEGVRRLDGVVLSHDDADHHGGARSVLEAMAVDWLLTSLPPGHALLGLSPSAIACRAGQSWEWDGVRFDVLWPGAEGELPGKAGDNPRSCVLRVSSRFGRALLAGDVERKAEAELVRRAGEGLQVSALVAPHHGSASGSSPEFVAAVRPESVVFTTGYRNAFGHPRPEIVERYRARGSRVFRSDADGAVTFFFDGRAAEVQTWRGVSRRYWQAAPASADLAADPKADD